MSVQATKTRVRSLLSRIVVREEDELERRLSGGLELVEKRLAECAGQATDPYVADVVGYLVAAGGKRLRPLLTLLAAEFGDPRAPGVVEAAVVSELVHAASLHHDDVMDEARIRHGVPSVNARWGNSVAVMAGNWLLATSARLSAELVREAVPLHSRASERLVRGQMLELLGPMGGDGPLPHYFGVVSDKSASLLSLSLQLGALQSGASAEVGHALAEYGEQLGVAFQISDDLLDITSPSAVTGKEQGKDLSVGVAGLPVLLALTGADPRDDELRALLDSPAGVTGEDHRRALALLRESAAMDRARTLRDERLDMARSALRGLSAGPPLRALEALCDVVATRTE
ncbi:polyprenyl synthetase family protein [Streptomyces sp. JHA26]|uniref:polyprenyl synthetase family protein n=1 Tax=Streptomyces sp. JHA26 TaxID=1917143 RepID=UPI00098B6566|nr:polyprenyl synthetase family protein [Streptomyces sp. JHA26]